MKHNNQEQLEMIKRIQSSEDGEEKRILKGILLEDYDEMIHDIAKYFDDGSFDIDDIVQEGYLAFISGIDNFDTRKKIKFEDFIHSSVSNKVEKALIEAKKQQSFPEEVTKKLNKIVDAEEALRTKLKRYPTNDEVSEYLGMEFADFFELKKYALELLSFTDSIDNMHKTLTELIAIKEEEDRNKEDEQSEDLEKEELEYCLDVLNEREKSALVYAYGLNGAEKLEYEDIAARLSTSTERVRQLVNLAKTKIKRELENNYEN